MKKGMTKEEIEARVEEYETKRRALADKIDDEYLEREESGYFDRFPMEPADLEQKKLCDELNKLMKNYLGFMARHDGRYSWLGDDSRYSIYVENGRVVRGLYESEFDSRPLWVYKWNERTREYDNVSGEVTPWRLWSDPHCDLK